MHLHNPRSPSMTNRIKHELKSTFGFICPAKSLAVGVWPAILIRTKRGAYYRQPWFPHAL